MNLQDQWNQAYNCFKSEDFSKALQLLKVFPEDPNVEFLKAQCLWKLGEYSVSIESFQKSLKLKPEEFLAHTSLIKALIANNQLELAINHLESTKNRFGANAFTDLYLELCSEVKIKDISALNLSRLFELYPNDSNIKNLNYLANKFNTHNAQFQKLEAPNNTLQSSYDYIFAKAPKIELIGLPKNVLFQALESVSNEGLYLEMGVYYGLSINSTANKLKDQIIHGFDSFEGLPEAWKQGEGKGSYSTNQYLPSVEKNVVLHKGWFNETLPKFLEENDESLAFLHIDCDIYSSTKDVFTYLKTRIVKGTVILFDDFFGYEGYEGHEVKAFNEFIESSRHSVEYLVCCPLGRELAVKIS